MRLCGREKSLTVGRMKMIVHNPTGRVYPATPDYVHALELRAPRRLLFLAGTMGLDAAGSPAPTLEGQLERIWTNIRTILAAAGMTVANIVRVTSYLRDGAYAQANGDARLAALNGRAVPTTAIVAATLADDWLVEVEVIAAE
jgi:enamine deaminase RidA (YjgF/YER057c/UK114 family)